MFDLGAGRPSELLKEFPEKARALIDASRNAFGLASRIASAAALPIGDVFSKRWLVKTNNPCLHDIRTMAEHLRMPGVYALNLCYEWGCTSGAWAQEASVGLARILDWPFPGLGRQMVVVQERKAAGEFCNVTWPGVAGIYQAMAKGRFAATLNQAPMRRYRGDIVTDWVRNRIRLWRSDALPPSHLLRHAFEQAKDYAEAKHLLSTTPLALPVIYVLGGIRPGEGCVIERIENDCAIHELGTRQNVLAANHFESHLNGIGHGWMPRATASHARCLHAAGIAQSDVDQNFTWFTPPVANELSRLALTMDARTGALSLMGTEGIHPVTEIFTLPNAA